MERNARENARSPAGKRLAGSPRPIATQVQDGPTVEGSERQEECKTEGAEEQHVDSSRAEKKKENLPLGNAKPSRQTPNPGDVAGVGLTPSI